MKNDGNKIGDLSFEDIAELLSNRFMEGADPEEVSRVAKVVHHMGTKNPSLTLDDAFREVDQNPVAGVSSRESHVDCEP